MNEARDMAEHPLTAILRRLRGPADLAPDSDHQLLQRFADGRDEEAFAELVRRYGATVWGVCRRGTHDPNDAEDVFQATFLVLAKKPTAVRPGHSLGGWLHGVAVRASAQARRGVARRIAHETEAARRNAVSENPPDATSAWLDEELRQLPARYRDPLVLCHVRGLDVAEAANELGCPANTVKTRLARGREMLKERLVRRGIVAPAVALAVAAPAELSAATIRFATDPTLAGVRPAVLQLVNATISGGMTMKLKLLAAAIVLCGVGMTGLAFSGQPATAPADENTKPAPAKVDPVKPEPPKADQPKIEPLERVDAEGIVIRVTPSTDPNRVGSLGIGDDPKGRVHSVIHVFGPKVAKFETRITKIANGKVVPAKFEDFAVGCRVQVRLAERGVWMQSDPPQGNAAEVRIVASAEVAKKLHLRGPVLWATDLQTRAKPGDDIFKMKVDGEKAADCKYDGEFGVWVNEKAKLVKSVNGKDEKAERVELKPGVRVEIELDGDDVAKSDPPQARAVLIRILPPAAKPEGKQ